MNTSETADCALHPFEKLRRLASRQVDELAAVRESLSDELNLVEHERFAKALIAMTKLVEHLFDTGDTPPRKTGDELKKEDDAIRAEFARRLAAIVRGRKIAADAAVDRTQAPAPHPS